MHFEHGLVFHFLCAIRTFVNLTCVSDVAVCAQWSVKSSAEEESEVIMIVLANYCQLRYNCFS